MIDNLKFIVSGGGTGGHIYPAIAIANELKLRFPKAEILFVGAKDKMEMQKVPQAGYPIEGLWIAGIQRKITLQNVLFPVKLINSLWQSRKIIKRFQPDAVIGTGGFAGGPLLQVASGLGIPTVIQEQNSFPGITNKLLSRKVNTICVAYKGLEKFFPKEKIVLTGNPVRQDLLDIETKKEEALAYFKLDATKKTILILGGSLGARRINQLAAKQVISFVSKDIQVIWQCGKLYYDEYKLYNERDNARVMPFIDRMDLAYTAADLIISRAGASSVSELSIVGKPVVFIPSPNVAEDHQTKNAQAIVNEKGALMLKESALENHFTSLFRDLLENKSLQKELSTNIRKLAKVNATRDIADEIVKLLSKTVN